MRKSTITIIVASGIIATLAGVGGYLVYPYLASFDTRFNRSQNALDGYARQVSMSNDALRKPPSRLGYFSVRSVEPLPNGFLFQSDYGNPFDWSGLAFSSTPLPEMETDAKGEIKQIFHPVRGGWYTVFRP